MSYQSQMLFINPWIHDVPNIPSHCNQTTLTIPATILSWVFIGCMVGFTVETLVPSPWREIIPGRRWHQFQLMQQRERRHGTPLFNIGAESLP
ncbi:MAG TPA: hypothetical protein VF172_12440 [Nitrososphaera sp.]|jgi:hypothetical protein